MTDPSSEEARRRLEQSLSAVRAGQEQLEVCAEILESALDDLDEEGRNSNRVLFATFRKLAPIFSDLQDTTPSEPLTN